MVLWTSSSEPFQPSPHPKKYLPESYRPFRRRFARSRKEDEPRKISTILGANQSKVGGLGNLAGGKACNIDSSRFTIFTRPRAKETKLLPFGGRTSVVKRSDEVAQDGKQQEAPETWTAPREWKSSAISSSNSFYPRKCRIRRAFSAQPSLGDIRFFPLKISILGKVTQSVNACIYCDV